MLRWMARWGLVALGVGAMWLLMIAAAVMGRS